jgi:hypothetical protein
MPDNLPEGGEWRQVMGVVTLLEQAGHLAIDGLRVITKREAEAIRQRDAEFQRLREEQKLIEEQKLSSREKILHFSRDNARSAPTYNDLVKSTRRMADRIRETADREEQFANLLSRLNVDFLGYFELEAAVLSGTALIVDRDTGDPEARYFTIMLSAKARHIFGGPLYATVAKIASVVLERQITTTAVKEWCRGVGA